MIKFFKKLSKQSLKDIDLTSLWNLAHPHLVPYHEETEDSFDVVLFADLRFNRNQWVHKVEVVFERSSTSFILPVSSQQQLRTQHPDLDIGKLDAVNAKLWSSKPDLINIEPTTRCNFNCWYCVGRHMHQADINPESFLKMLENFPELKTIALVGEGEPLLHKDFFKMAEAARSRGIKVLIISNGSAFSQSVIQKLCETEVAYVSISIDSANPETFSKSRIDGNLEKVWQGISNLRKYRDDNGFKYPKISLKGTLFDSTIDELPEIAEAAKKHGVELFESFQPLNPMHNYVRIYPEEQKRELDTIDKVQASINRDTLEARKTLKPFSEFCKEEGINFFPEVNPNPKKKNCDETWLYSLLSGDITPCCQIKTPPSNNWNIFKRSAQTILNDPEYENMRFNLWNGIFPNYCAGCWKTR